MIRVEHLAKYYGGKRALGPVSFEIGAGECVGFLGLNGAGKTTTLRILACDLRPSAGTVRIRDVDAVRAPHDVRKLVGFLPETPPLYPEMTVRDYLTFAGRLRRMDDISVRKRLPQVAETTQLSHVLDEVIRHLSHGYKQRVGVAQAVIHEPSLLILDEPTRGLDPVQIVEMRTMIQELKRHHTILISSHILPEISETCDRILVLGEGAILAAGSEEELSRGVHEVREIEVDVARPIEAGADFPQKLVALISAVPDVALVDVLGVTPTDVRLFVHAGSDVRASVCRALVQDGHGVTRLARREKGLENVFLSLVKGAAHAAN